MNLRQQAFSAVFWTAIRSWGSQLMAFVVFVALARLLPPDAFGLVAYTTVFLGFLQVFVAGGFSKAIVQREQLDPEHLDTAFWTNTAIALALCAGVLGFADPVADLLGDARIGPLLRWLALGFLLNALGDMHVAVLRRELAIKALAGKTLIGQAVGGAVGITMAVQGYGVWALVGQSVSAATSTTLILWTTGSWRPGFQVSRRHFDDIVSFGFSVVGTNLLQFTATHIDRLLIGALLGPAALGIYVVGFRAIRVVVELVTKILTQVALPVFSRMQDDLPAMRRGYVRALRGNCVVTFPAYCGMAGVAPDLVPTLFGEQWVDAVPVVQVLCLLGVAQSMQLFSGPITNAMGKPHWLMGVTGTSAVLTAGLISGAATYGIVAVAGAVALRQWLLLPLQLGIVRRLTGVPIGEVLRVYVTPLVASLVMGAAAYGLAMELRDTVGAALRLAICTVGGALLYAALIRFFAPAHFADVQEMIVGVLPERLRRRTENSGGSKG